MRIETLKQTDPALYADMDFHMRSGEWTVIHDSPTSLWLRWNRGWLHDVAAFDLTEARKLLSQISLEDALCLRGCEGLRELASELGFNGCNPCRQAVYEKPSSLPVRTELTIRHPDEKDFPKVAESYHLATEEELREDFASPDFLGGYLGDEFVGYIGVHSEGSMGLLYVFPPYRRRGCAEALYRTLINSQLQKGRLPFAQIIEGNESSMALQRKIGLRLSDGLLYWMWHEKEGL